MYLQGGGYIVLLLLYIIVIMALIKREISYSPLSWGMFGGISGSIGVVLYTTTRDELVPVVSGVVTAGQCAIALTAWLMRNKNEPLKTGEKIAGLLWLVSMGAWWWAQTHSDSSIARILSVGGMLIADLCAISPILRNGWEKPEEDEPFIWLGFGLATILIISGSDGSPFTRPGLIYGYYELVISIIMFLIVTFRRKHLKRAWGNQGASAPFFYDLKIPPNL
jgi:hypothetical protein